MNQSQQIMEALGEVKASGKVKVGGTMYTITDHLDSKGGNEQWGLIGPKGRKAALTRSAGGVFTLTLGGGIKTTDTQIDSKDVKFQK